MDNQTKFSKFVKSTYPFDLNELMKLLDGITDDEEKDKVAKRYYSMLRYNGMGWFSCLRNSTHSSEASKIAAELLSCVCNPEDVNMQIFVIKNDNLLGGIGYAQLVKPIEKINNICEHARKNTLDIGPLMISYLLLSISEALVPPLLSSLAKKHTDIVYPEEPYHINAARTQCLYETLEKSYDPLNEVHIRQLQDAYIGTIDLMKKIIRPS